MNDSECQREIFIFLLSFKWCSQNEFVSQFTCLQYIYMSKYTRHVLTYALENDNEQHFSQWWPEHIDFFLPFAFLENTYHERSLVNQQNAITNFEPFKCIELLFVSRQVAYKYCDRSFLNKPTFFNIVPQLIKKTYRTGRT